MDMKILTGDLIHYITKNFHSIRWATKLWELRKIVDGLIQIHKVNIAHRDFHSGNILLNRISLKFIRSIKISVLGRSNSATESGDNNENYDIGPVTINNPNAIYRSRPQSAMINSAISLRNSRSQSINLERVKRRFKDDLIENNNYYGQSIKRNKLYENKDYLTRELEF
ncbi:uncharacterized protein OCT59_020929 [Rhizophagus irregularis]|uniref:uncharacterized protein n=1 Tax=Rhizophagus irregularis TaxID=588596 RepID=UPI00331FD3F0|nr:hypothetical protein OCT59_020929 [Rhizophagus irregularis]